MTWPRWIVVAFMIGLMAQGFAQGWYIGASQSFFTLSSSITGSLGIAVGVKLDDHWGLRSSGSIQAARTFGLVGLTLDGLYRPPEGGYVGLGLGLEYAVVPALPSNLETTLRAILGNEWLVTPYWGVYLEMLFQHNLNRSLTTLDCRLGLNLYLVSQDEKRP